MIVYFSASSRNIKKDIVIYKRIMHAIRSAGHAVSNDWTENALIASTEDFTSSRMHEVVADASKSIETSEVMVAEVSGGSTFGVGYEVSLALQHKKPVLLLVRESMRGSSYATGLKNELIMYCAYNDTTLEKYIADFLSEYEIATKDLRFNFVIDRKIYNHLRLKSFKSGKTKAEVVRDLLLEDMSSSR